MNTRLLFSALILFSVVFTVGSIDGFAPTVQADDDDDQFSLESLEGAWGFNASGSVAGAPASAVGRLVFDGQGRCIDIASLNLGGVVFALSSTGPGGSCSYTVNEDGTARLDVTFFNPDLGLAPFLVDLIIVSDEDEFLFIASGSDPALPTIASGVGKRQDD